jgi:peptide/nickel transport system permease protein
MAERAAAAQLEVAEQSIESPRARAWRRFRRHRMAMLGLTYLVVICLVAIAAPLTTGGRDPAQIYPVNSWGTPSWEFLLGGDQLGRDIWARLVYGSRVSLAVGIVSMSIAVVIALVLGTLSGYFGGTVDMIIMRFTDVMMVFPGLILIMIVVSVFEPSIWNVMLVIGLLGWTGMARLVRGQILSVREWDFVMAARCLGVSDRLIMIRHVLPNVLAPLMVAATFGIAAAILTEAGLSFLGLGVKPPTPSWGVMLNAAHSLTVLERYWWVWIPPGVAVLLTVMAINFMGDGLRDALDPRAILS